MTPKQYRAAIEKVGLSQISAARFFGVYRRTGQRWASDGPPEPVALFLRLMARLKLTAAQVDALLDREPPE